jgi:hypothetical protein
MSRVKDIAYLTLIILVSINGLYEWVSTDTLLKSQTGVGTISTFELGNLKDIVDSLGTSVGNITTTSPLSDPAGFAVNVAGGGINLGRLIAKLAFGWSELVIAILTGLGLASLQYVFVPGFAVMQIIGFIYLLTDIRRAVLPG